MPILSKKYKYSSTQKSVHGGKKTVKNVTIKNGKGHKSVTEYSRGKKKFSVKKPLTIMEIQIIQTGKFIPGLFKDCKKQKCKPITETM